MRVDVITIFPELFGIFLDCSIVGRARERGLLDIKIHNLREYATDKHRTVDDTPYGGGPGMVMKPEPWFKAISEILGQEQSSSNKDARGEVILLTPRGERLTQSSLERFAGMDHIVLLCGRYEGIDDRVRKRWASAEISLGDFVLNGGEVAAQAIIEGVIRLLPGALGDPESALLDSFTSGLLDHRHFTKPPEYDGLKVPKTLLSGNHEEIRVWRKRDALKTTLRYRPDLLENIQLDEELEALLLDIQESEDTEETIE